MIEEVDALRAELELQRLVEASEGEVALQTSVPLVEEVGAEVVEADGEGADLVLVRDGGGVYTGLLGGAGLGDPVCGVEPVPGYSGSGDGGFVVVASPGRGGGVGSVIKRAGAGRRKAEGGSALHLVEALQLPAADEERENAVLVEEPATCAKGDLIDVRGRQAEGAVVGGDSVPGLGVRVVEVLRRIKRFGPGEGRGERRAIREASQE